MQVPPSLLVGDDRGRCASPAEESAPPSVRLRAPATEHERPAGGFTTQVDSAPWRCGPCRGDEIAGRYRLSRLLWEGCMGCVWAAEDLDDRRRVALMVLEPSEPSKEGRACLRRELREAYAVVRSAGSRRCRVIAGAAESPIIMIEYLRGVTLAERLLGLSRQLPPRPRPAMPEPKPTTSGATPRTLRIAYADREAIQAPSRSLPAA
ncbi:MAG: hypothetical protein JRI23_14020 [Deltaproteobacteria bacterium]|nr:hypothetical protein [Deltaproteobacteria bacterium]